MSSSLGVTIPNLWKVIKFHGSKAPTSHLYSITRGLITIKTPLNHHENIPIKSPLDDQMISTPTSTWNNRRVQSGRKAGGSPDLIAWHFDRRLYLHQGPQAFCFWDAPSSEDSQRQNPCFGSNISMQWTKRSSLWLSMPHQAFGIKINESSITEKCQNGSYHKDCFGCMSSFEPLCIDHKRPQHNNDCHADSDPTGLPLTAQKGFQTFNVSSISSGLSVTVSIYLSIYLSIY